MRRQKILFVCRACRWFDKINGNTYHSVRITRVKDGEVLAHPLTYGYGDSYRQTALELMLKSGWLRNISKETLYSYERLNNYPILWEVSDGLKRDAVCNGQL